MDNDERFEGNLQALVGSVAADAAELDDGLHPAHLTFYHFVKQFFADFWEWKEVDTSVVFGAETLWDVRKEAEVDVVSNERGERGKTSAQGIQHFEEGI